MQAQLAAVQEISQFLTTSGLKHFVIGGIANAIWGRLRATQDADFKVLVGALSTAAMSNSAHFRFQTAAILVGQPIGETPNSYQEARETTLPNSRLVLRYSAKYYKFVESGDNIIRPDKEIVPSWPEYKSRRDPVIDWVLNYH